MLNRLTEADFEMISDYIDRYAPGDGYLANPAPIQERLRFWAEEKKNLGRLFGDKLILKREIEYKASVEELNERYYRQFATSNCHIFYDKLWNLFYSHDCFNDLLKSAFEEPVANGYWSAFSYLSSRDALMSNRWEAPETIFPLPEGKSFKVAPGTKINRILGKLAKAWDLPYWEDVREAQAKALTTKNTKGTLCLSIHPMDYMTMSDNLEGWHSCMSWQNDGGYRGGTVEMLNSPNVIVAYLEHPTHLLEDCWNSKIWRELFIVDNNIIANIKSYPHRNDYLTKYVLSWIKELAETSGYGAYEDCPILLPCGNPDYAESKDELHPWSKEHKICFEFLTDSMYNDTGRVPQYAYVSSALPYHDKYTYYSINYSGPRICMWCGKEVSQYNWDDESQLVCDACEQSHYTDCQNCGERIDIDGNEAYTLDDCYYCEECYEELAVSPYDDPWENHNKWNCTPLYIKLPNGTLTEQSVYIYDMDRFAKKYYGSDANTFSIPIECVHWNYKRYIPYEMAENKLRIECGIPLEETGYWDNYKPEPEPEEKEKKKTNKFLDTLIDFLPF